MEVKTVKCDQCGREIKEHEYGQLVVSNVTLQDWDNNSTSIYSHYSGKYSVDSLNLCPDCAISFLAFFKLPSWIKKIVDKPQSAKEDES
jgi:ribosomal protein S26